MPKRKATKNTVSYMGSCELCHGQEIVWYGPQAKRLAQKHLRDTQHRGVWFVRTSQATYYLSSPLTSKELAVPAVVRIAAHQGLIQTTFGDDQNG